MIGAIVGKVVVALIFLVIVEFSSINKSTSCKDKGCVVGNCNRLADFYGLSVGWQFSRKFVEASSVVSEIQEAPCIL